MVKLTKRKGFNFFRSYYDVYNELSDKDKVLFMDALLDRQFLGVKPNDLKGMASFAYISQTNSIDSQVKGYEDKTKTKLCINTPTQPPTAPPTYGGKNPPTEQVQVKEKEKVQVKEKVKENAYPKEVHDCFNNCLTYFPIHLHPKGGNNKNNWLDTIQKLSRIDKIPFELIEQIVKRTRENDFWAKNFISITKLRKKNKEGIMYIIVFNEQTKNQQNETTTKKSRYQKVLEHNMETARQLAEDKKRNS